MGFGLRANVGKVFVIDGATLAVLSVMNDPDFELIQPQHFGGQLGAVISVSPDFNGDGVADLIAGVPQYIVDPESKTIKAILGGKAVVFSGKDGALLFTLNDPTAEEDGRCGAAVAALNTLLFLMRRVLASAIENLLDRAVMLVLPPESGSTHRLECSVLRFPGL
jgi:hypothetical protein